MYNDIHPSVHFGQNVTIREFNYIGRNVTIGNNTKIANHCDINADVFIGKNCNLQTHVVLSQGTTIGDNCWLAGGVMVADEKFPAVGRQVRLPTIIGKNVVIGMGALIIGAVIIGDDAVIGMGAVVTRHVPVGQVWVGNPAKPVIDKVTGNIMSRADYDARKQAWEYDIESGRRY